jgi:hypothetical protein
MAAAQGYVTPELLDARIDLRHRSYCASVLGEDMGHIRARVPLETMPLDARWLPRFVLYKSFKLIVTSYL